MVAQRSSPPPAPSRPASSSPSPAPSRSAASSSRAPTPSASAPPSTSLSSSSTSPPRCATHTHPKLLGSFAYACLRCRAHPPPSTPADSSSLRCPREIDFRKMINLFKIKGQKKEEAANAKGGPPAKKQSPGELRLHKDIAELNLPKTTKISFPNGKDDLMNFEATLRPDEGYYVGGTFVFTFQVSPAYPHEPPKVKCKTKVYHPNIDLEGNVCLNILREDWKPVLNINTIIYGLNLLFTQPNDEDPLNHDAAAVLRDNPQKFQRNVQMAMSGGYVDNIHFPRCI